MNDFTKEELKELWEGLDWKYSEGDREEITIPLMEKIKSMIDNYCDHKKYIENLVTGYVCEKCGKPENE